MWRSADESKTDTTAEVQLTQNCSPDWHQNTAIQKCSILLIFWQNYLKEVRVLEPIELLKEMHRALGFYLDLPYLDASR